MPRKIIIEDIVDNDNNNVKKEDKNTIVDEFEVIGLKKEVKRLFKLVEKLRDEKLDLIFENAALIEKLNDI